MTTAKTKTKVFVETEEPAMVRRIGMGTIVLYTVPKSLTVVPAIVVEASADGTATLQVFRTSSDGTYLMKNVRPDNSGAEGTYFA